MGGEKILREDYFEPQRRAFLKKVEKFKSQMKDFLRRKSNLYPSLVSFFEECKELIDTSDYELKCYIERGQEKVWSNLLNFLEELHRKLYEMYQETKDEELKNILATFDREVVAHSESLCSCKRELEKILPKLRKK